MAGVDNLAAQIVKGTAATGAPMPNATINATCGSVSGTATTATDGTYTVKIAGGSLPCVLTATSSDGTTVLHSVVAGTGTSSGAAVAQITPLTELLVAQLAAGDPAKFVSSFSSTTAISSDAVSAANTAIISALKAAGLDVSAITDIASGTISAGSGTGYDGVLDALKKAIAAANTSLAELTAAVGSTAGSSTSQSAVMGTALAPAAPSCPSLKGGTHRVIDFTDNVTYTATVDATNLTVSANGKNYTLTKNNTCDYTLIDANHTPVSRVLVAKSGMAVWMNGGGNNVPAAGTIGVSFPAQTLDPKALGAVYNRVTYGAANVLPNGAFGTTTFDAAGVNTSSVNCTNGVASCAPDPTPSPLGHLVATADGGVDYVDNGGSIGAHAFGFRNAQGQIVLIATEASGAVSVLSKQTPLSLPAVGAAVSFWQFRLVPTTATPLVLMPDDSNTVTAVDPATSLVTRKFQDNHTDQITFNNPFPGTRYRAPNACTTTTGAAGTCSSVVQLPLQDEGINLAMSANPNNPFLSVSITKP